jgi:hypothetical protein
MAFILVGVCLGLAIAGLVVFAALCAAIRHDDRCGLPARAPSLTARLTRWLVGFSGTGRCRARSAADPSPLVGAGAGRSSHPNADGG